MLHTDSFCLLKNARKIGANERNYAINKVDQLFKSPRVQQALELRELYGYYGHGLREKIGKLRVPEMVVIMHEGKPVVLNAAPSNVCVDLSIDTDTGIITHTEEVFEESDGGKVVASMIRGKIGGWSWATGGDESAICITNAIAGFDYVKMPNYISIFHPASKGMMLESASGGSGAGGRQYSEQGVMFLESMKSAGYGQEAIDSIIEDMQKGVVDLDLIAHYREQAMILEAVAETRALELMRKQSEAEQQLAEVKQLAEKKTRMFLDAVEALPVFIGEKHRQALSRMETKEDLQVVQALFESVASLPSGRLPNIGQPTSETVPVSAPKVDVPILGFNRQTPPKFG